MVGLGQTFTILLGCARNNIILVHVVMIDEARTALLLLYLKVGVVGLMELSASSSAAATSSYHDIYNNQQWGERTTQTTKIQGGYG